MKSLLHSSLVHNNYLSQGRTYKHFQLSLSSLSTLLHGWVFISYGIIAFSEWSCATFLISSIAIKADYVGSKTRVTTLATGSKDNVDITYSMFVRAGIQSSCYIGMTIFLFKPSSNSSLLSDASVPQLSVIPNLPRSTCT